jgi:hypothetical protein
MLLRWAGLEMYLTEQAGPGQACVLGEGAKGSGGCRCVAGRTPRVPITRIVIIIIIMRAEMGTMRRILIIRIIIMRMRSWTMRMWALV